MALTESGLKLLTIKVRGIKSSRTPQPDLVGFLGIKPEDTRRRYVGEVFEILATPYQKKKQYQRGIHDTPSRQFVDGDPREAECSFFGWPKSRCEAYLKFQFFNPEVMELVDTQDAEGQESEMLPNDYLLNLDEKSAIKAVRKQDDGGTLAAWLAAEKTAKTPRPKVITAIEETIAED